MQSTVLILGIEHLYNGKLINTNLKVRLFCSVRHSLFVAKSLAGKKISC
jgi:hypothetical protein